MLLLALQTSTSTAGDSTIDAVTLVLVVLFIASMVALSVLLRRGNDAPAAERDIAPPLSETAIPRPVVAPASPRAERPPLPTTAPAPVWLDGVGFPPSNASLAAATQVIELLLSARRDHDLGRGLALYTPELLRSLRASLGVDEEGLAEALSAATFDGEPPALRSIEIVSASGNRMTVRVGYASGSAECYRLVDIDNRWSIEEILPDR